MTKKKSATGSAIATKKVKAAQKVERKEMKKVTKTKGGHESEEDDDDLEGILEKMRKEWEEAHIVTEELVEGPPSRRANATLTACPVGNHLWCIGGEFFNENGRAYFYNDIFRYTPEKDEWRKFVSPTCPGPRSAHAVVASAAGGGKLFLFGGEFSSLHQNTFHHYRDFWCFDISSHSWNRIDTKVRPSARSGHRLYFSYIRMAIWKDYIVLFGGFYDPGITTRYLNDLWLFDMQEYKWHQIVFRETDLKPSPRSGFSFLSCADGIVLHGGYCKEYVKGKRPVGVISDDTWLLKITLASDSANDPALTTPSTKSKGVPTLQSSKSKSATQSGLNQEVTVKWERRKRASDAYAPSLRSGCTMALWAAKGMGIMFGGVTDEDTSEESLESTFWNDLYGYQLAGKGRWISMALKKYKAKAKGQKKKIREKQRGCNQDSDFEDYDIAWDREKIQVPSAIGEQQTAESDDPSLTVPRQRYNAMLAVLRNTLYIYGGIYERGSHEYTLDDFYSLHLDKLDRYECLKKSDIIIPEGEDESSSDDDSDEEGDGSYEYDDQEEQQDWDLNVGEDQSNDADYDEQVKRHTRPKDSKQKGKEKHKLEEIISRDKPQEVSTEKQEVDSINGEENSLRSQASAFMGVSKDTVRSEEDVLSTPLPGETLAMFYARSREYWSQKAFSGTTDNRGKQLRKEGFSLAEERYVSYKPVLEEVENILAEAGLDEEEMRRGAAGEPSTPGGMGQSRNRR